MGMRESVVVLRAGVRRAADLSGREGLSGFRKFAVTLVVVHMVLAVVGRYLMFVMSRLFIETETASDWVYGSGLALLLVFYLLLSAAGVRRLHDVGRRGAWILMPAPFLVVGFGAQILANAGTTAGGSLGCSFMSLVEMFCGAGASLTSLYLVWCLTRPGEFGPNRYGEAPMDDDQRCCRSVA